MELVPNLSPFGGVRRTWPGITHVFPERIDRTCLPRCHLVEPPIDDDPRQPGPERPREIEAVDVLKRREERVLNQILRVFTVPQQTHRQRHCPGEVSLDDSPERVTLTDPNASEKLLVVIGLIVRAKHERCA